MNSCYRAKTLEDALQNLHQGMTPFAGGTDIMVRHMQWSGIAELNPFFIGHLQELKTIHSDDDSLTIGAACTLTQLIGSPFIPASLKKVLATIAAPAVRNRATIGGNICNASPAADTLPWLYAMDAVLTLQSKEEKRTLPIAEFITGPGAHQCLAHELVTAVTVPHCSFSGTFHHKVAARRSNALSKLSFIGLFRQVEGILKDIRMTFGAVGPTVIRNRDLEATCCGRTSSELLDLVPEIIGKYEEIISPINDQRSTSDYRRTTALNLLRHFLTEVAIELSGTPNSASFLTRED